MTTSTTVDSIKKSLVALKMARALEVLDATLRRIEQGKIDAIEALDQLLLEEVTLRETRRIKAALMLARLTAIKTLAGFDFVFQPSLDKSRILALAELKFIDRAEVLHLLGPPGTGKSHLDCALAVEAVKSGRSVSSPRSPISWHRSSRPNEKDSSENASASSPVPRCWSSTRSNTSRSRRRRQFVLQAGQCPIREGRHDPHLQSRLRGMGRGVRRHRRRHGSPRPTSAPCRRHPDRRIELSAPPARRSRARACALESHRRPADGAQTAQPPPLKEDRRSRQRLISDADLSPPD